MDSVVPEGAGKRPALVILHGSGGHSGFWLDRFAPLLRQAGVAAFAPHYFDRTGTTRATPETILDGRHFPQWLGAVRDAVAAVAAEPGVDAGRVALLGVSLGGYLTVAALAEGVPVRAGIEISGGMPPGWEGKLSPATPPMLVVHGDADTVVPVREAERLRRLLAEGGVRHKVELLKGEGHWFSAGAVPRLLFTCGMFLRAELR